MLAAPHVPRGGPGGLEESPVQTNVITTTSNGVYNTPVDIYALHSCLDNHDYYLVNTGGDWTATEAQFSSASEKAFRYHYPATVAAFSHLIFNQAPRTALAELMIFNGDQLSVGTRHIRCGTRSTSCRRTDRQ